MSDIIKNPNRNRPRPVEIRKPEYERLGLNPVPFTPGKYPGTESMLPIALPKRGGTIAPNPVLEIESLSSEDMEIGDGQVIDNNDFVSFSSSLIDAELSSAIDSGELIDLDKSSIPEIGDYILMISGNIIMPGKLKEVEKRVKDILYGDDIDFIGLGQEEIVVLKRVELQVGVFIKD